MSVLKFARAPHTLHPAIQLATLITRNYLYNEYVLHVAFIFNVIGVTCSFEVNPNRTGRHKFTFIRTIL